jgi:hypothetical protein
MRCYGNVVHSNGDSQICTVALVGYQCSQHVGGVHGELPHLLWPVIFFSVSAVVFTLAVFQGICSMNAVCEFPASAILATGLASCNLLNLDI